MKPLCLVPWTNIDIDPRGAIAPCCKYQTPVSDEMNITKNTIQDYIASDGLKKIKKQMLANQWPDGCVRCHTEEKSNIKSKRQLDYERWQDAFDKYTEDQGFLTASIAFGNTCNLKCITCGPTASSRWRKEYIDLYGVDRPPLQTIDNMTSHDIYNALPNAIHFDIPGGEPFLSEIETQLQLLQRYVDNGTSEKISLHYTTNSQIWPDHRWWELWKNFKEIDIQLSIDGVQQRYEYIRYPAKYSTLEKHVDQYLEQQQNIASVRLSVSHTISAYNILYLDEFFAWCEQKTLPRPWCCGVHAPAHMRPQVYKKSIKDKIVKKLQQSDKQDVITWSEYLQSNDSSEYYEKFLQMKDAHDTYRNTNFAKTFPELQELIVAD